MKKIMKYLCGLLVLALALGVFGVSGKEAKAASNDAIFTEERDGVTISKDMKTPQPTTAGKEDYIFAGYYNEKDCTTPVTQSTDETVYAKFVPSTVLSVKAQIQANTTEESAKTNLRLTSSVDSLKYKAVGFEVYYDGATKPIVIKSTSVFKRIVASETSGVDYNFSPKMVDTESEYFVTATLVNIANKNFDKSFYIKPYWQTLDGTTVYGEGKYFTIENGLDENNINATIRTSERLDDTIKATVAGKEYSATVAYQDDTYAYLNINVNDKKVTELDSLNTILAAGATTTYRNVMKKYTGTADTSWYTNDSDNAFIIATGADLYGLADLVNNQSITFEGKEIYVVADITINDGNANAWKTSAPQDIKAWKPIGKTNRFKGVFDAQMHTISGLYAKETSANTGLFGCVEGATIKNLQLMNSCFVTTSTDAGSIVGAAPGCTLENIYSDAIVVSSNKRVGGLVGQASKVTTIQNCWFDGSVSSTHTSTDVLAGGLVGLVQSEGTQCQILNCINSGTVSATATSDAGPEVGGLLGGKYTNKSTSILTVKNCLNIGTVNGPASVSSDFGAIVGYNANGTYENVYATAECCENAKTKPTGTETVAMADILGTSAKSNLKGLDFEKVWATVTAYNPVLKVFQTTVIDDTWYDETKDTYVLRDKADLYGFALLSQENNFAGKTVKLAANIKVNTGSSADWGTTAPKNMWLPIGNATVPFAGTFDGGLHTISGVYLKTAAQGGLFSQTAATAQVKNLYLKNSYFESSSVDLGSIVGVAKGTFSNIYSNATVKSTLASNGNNGNRVGGIAGKALNGFRLLNAHFDGEVSSEMTDKIRIGGLIGSAYEAGDYFIYNCLNSGLIDIPGATGSEVDGAGLVGHALSNTANLVIVNSLNVGTINCGAGAGEVDALVGWTKKSYSFTNVYALQNSCENDASPFTFGGKKIENASDIHGDLASDVLAGFNFAGVWKEVTGSTPVLDLTAAQDYDATWFDATATEYVLYDKEDLYAFAEMSQVMNFAGKTVKLGADIVVNTGNASEWATATPEYGWMPIGSYANRFAGTFDGDNHTISGLYLLTGYRRQGLFSATAEGSTVKNLRLTNSYFKSTVTGGQSEFGSIVGDAIGTFTNIYSNAIIVGSGIQNGGILGYVTGNSTIDNAWFDGSITNSRTTDLRIGGIVGHVAKEVTADFTNCLNTGAISGPNATGNDVCIGGIVGWVGTSATMTNCLGLGPVSALNGGNNIGSIAGHDAGEVITVTNVFGTTESHKWKGVTAASRDSLSTIRGVAAETKLAGFDFVDTWAVVENNTPVLKSFYDVVVDTSWYDEEENTFVLDDMGDLYGFTLLSKETNFEGKTINLGKDIVVNKGTASTWGTTAPIYMWLPIEEFAGTFDGQNHTISGIFFNGSLQNAGLFRKTLATAEIKNFTLDNSYIKNTAKNTGGVVGSAMGTIHNVHCMANVVSTSQYVGGVVGAVGGSGFTMTQCSFGGSVEGSYAGDIEMGGLIGYINSSNTTVRDCLNTGTVTGNNGSSDEIGGLIGCLGSSSASGTKVENLLNLGSVSSLKTSTSEVNPTFGYYSTSVKGVSNVYATDAIAETTPGTKVELANIKGDAARQTLIGFDFNGIWKTRANGTPVLRTEEVTIDEYIVKGAADLVAISKLSLTDNFEGKVIKLAEDIDMDGISWTPICADASAKRFAGTFDGQGYTISNLNVSNTAGYAGLFASTNSKSVIKNLIIDSATINSTDKFVGVVAGQGLGTFSNIRVTNSEVAAKGRMAGLVGLAEGSITMTNCSFDGTVTCSGNEKENRYVGGLIGYASAGNLRMSNCLNLGDVYDSAECESDKPGVGGIIGCISASVKTIEIHSCVNAGTVTVRSASAVSDYGPFIGRLNLPTNGFELYELTKNYTVPSTDTSIVEDIQVVETATNETMLLLDWENHWEMVEGVPQVRFAKTDFTQKNSIEVDATALTNLTTLYANRNLKQGDIHAHANNGGASDGTVSLSDWKTKMIELDMDFAASLDHRETDHIRLNDWDKDKFIYGTELGAGIHDSATKVNGQDLGIHYNMMFSKEEDFVNLLTKTEFSDDFDYSATARSYAPYNGGHIKEAGFDTTAELKRFIQAVQAYNGFYVLAHPMNSPSYITADNWTTYLKPYAVDGMGIEVMYDALTGSQCKKGYELWKAMLNDGYKVYATAGTDTHKNLETQHPSGPWEALTSIYATKENGENYWSEAYLRYLINGNFTAGSVGIQMCVGDTQMGGTGSFLGKYLEVGVGALHKSVYNPDHKYRVEIWSNEGLVYTQEFDATTDESQMTYLRMKADADSQYYRVEIFDSTTNLRIALGNPIWNSAK